jgi:hypothetical protein
MKKGWVRFMDEMPNIGMEVWFVYSSFPYNGMSFGIKGFRDENNFMTRAAIADGRILRTPIFDIMNPFADIYSLHAGYAHHWADLSRVGLDVSEICEYARIKRGETEPVKIINNIN